MPHPRALLLDFDGTLANSVGALRHAYGLFMSQQSLQPTDAEFDTLNGPPLEDIVSFIRKKHKLDTAHSELLAIYRQHVARAYDQVEPALGAKDILDAARKSGWLTGIVTSNLSALVKAWLGTWGLADRVDVVIGGDSVGKGKPDPEPYLKALRLLRATAIDSIAVEDSVSGIRASTGAGVTTWAIDPDRKISDQIRDLPRIAGVGRSLVDIAEKIF